MVDVRFAAYGTVVVMVTACLSASPAPEHAADAMVAGAADAGLDCTERFGDLPGYLACEGAAGECSVYTTGEGSFSCETLCANLATRCVASYNTSGETPTCAPSSKDEMCQELHGGQICTCAPAEA